MDTSNSEKSFLSNLRYSNVVGSRAAILPVENKSSTINKKLIGNKYDLVDIGFPPAIIFNGSDYSGTSIHKNQIPFTLTGNENVISGGIKVAETTLKMGDKNVWVNESALKLYTPVFAHVETTNHSATSNLQNTSTTTSAPVVDNKNVPEQPKMVSIGKPQMTSTILTSTGKGIGATMIVIGAFLNKKEHSKYQLGLFIGGGIIFGLSFIFTDNPDFKN